MNVQLPVHEELFLLALSEKGKLSLPRKAIGASIIAELLIRGLVALEQHDKGFLRQPRDLIRVTNVESIGEDVLDECLKNMSKSHRPKKVHHWVSKFELLSGIKNHIAELLIARNILQRNHKTWSLSRIHFRVVDRKVKEDIETRLCDAIQTDHFSVDTRTSSLIAIAYETGVLSGLLGRRTTFKKRSRIKKICRHDPIARALRIAIKEMEIQEVALGGSA